MTTHACRQYRRQRNSRSPKRLADLDRERTDCVPHLIGWSKTQRQSWRPRSLKGQAIARGNQLYLTSIRLPCFARFSGVVKTFFLADGKMQSPVNLATRRHVKTNGYAASVRNLGSSAAIVQQAFVPVSDAISRSHLQGRDVTVSGRAGPFVAGVYPLLVDETCWFLAADFDKQSWQRDALAFLGTCREKGVPAALERSRSAMALMSGFSFLNP